MNGPRRYAALLALCCTANVYAQDAQRVFDKVSPSVVTIKLYDAAGVADGEGSGVVVGPNEVVTNCHVIEDARTIQVIGHKGDERKAVPARGDVNADVCLLRVENLASPAVPLRAGADVAQGERVFAIGNPLGLGLAVSEGLASALVTLQREPRILTSAPVSPGSSGGGLFDMQGRLVGITTAILRAGQNVNVVVPADLITRVRKDGEAVVTAAPLQKDVDWYGIGEKLRLDGQWQALADHAKQLLEKYPTSYDAAQMLGRAQLYLGQAERARDTLSALAKRFPQAPRVFSFLAQAHRALGNLDLAEAAARQAIALGPGDDYAAAVLAEVQVAARKFEDGRKSADAAIRLAPWLRPGWEARADIAFAEKRYADAASDMRVVARLEPTNWRVRRKLAYALAMAGETGEARTLMASGGTPEAADAEVWFHIGNGESQLKRYSDAENAGARSKSIQRAYTAG